MNEPIHLVIYFGVHLEHCIPAEYRLTYFQQEVNYTIHVALDDEAHELSGDIEMEYTNRSPNALAEIYIHLWPNACKNSPCQTATSIGE